MEIPKAVGDVLRVAAPTLLAALGGPFGGIAASIASAALDAWLGPVPADAAQAPRGVPPSPSAGGATPDDVVQVVYANAQDPRFLMDLRKAELDLVRYEQEMGFRFAALQVEDRKRAGTFQAETGIAAPLFRAGMALVLMSLVIMLLTIAGCLSLLFGLANLPAGTSAEMAAAVFGLIGQTIGFINGMSGVIVAFYWGGSQGDHNNTSRIADTMQDLARASVEQASRVTPAFPMPAGPVAGDSGDDAPPVRPLALAQPAVPAPPGLLAELLPELTKPHRHFQEGVYWALTPNGVSIEGAPALGTPGEPTTVRTIWKRYGDLCSASARRYGVPVELLTATIAVESRGDPNARREEPQINDRSIGLVQTLVRTARQALGRPDLREDELLDPATSINAGAAYIAQQRSTTHFDPVKVPAAYNAGSIRKDKSESNPFRMVCYGNGKHIADFVAFFNDSMRVSTADGWGGDGVPSFATCLAAQSSPSAA